jgi:hypothetical protein
MNSSVTSRFWREYFALPADIRRKARKAFRLWRRNPRHPSLRFQPKGGYWSVRIDRGWRALARVEGDTAYWLTIVSHDEYEELLRRK